MVAGEDTAGGTHLNVFLQWQSSCRYALFGRFCLRAALKPVAIDDATNDVHSILFECLHDVVRVSGQVHQAPSIAFTCEVLDVRRRQDCNSSPCVWETCNFFQAL